MSNTYAFSSMQLFPNLISLVVSSSFDTIAKTNTIYLLRIVAIIFVVFFVFVFETLLYCATCFGFIAVLLVFVLLLLFCFSTFLLCWRSGGGWGR